MNEKWERYGYVFSVSETDTEIADVFFSGGSIYIGSNCGAVDYCEIGNIYRLIEIMYRVDNVYCDLVFEFDVYRVHVAMDAAAYDDITKISVFDCKNGKWECEYCTLTESKTIEMCIRKISSKD